MKKYLKKFGVVIGALALTIGVGVFSNAASANGVMLAQYENQQRNDQQSSAMAIRTVSGVIAEKAPDNSSIVVRIGENQNATITRENANVYSKDGNPMDFSALQTGDNVVVFGKVAAARQGENAIALAAMGIVDMSR